MNIWEKILEIPVILRYYLIGIVASAVGLALHSFNIHNFLLSFYAIFELFHFWKLVTPFLFLGKVSFGWLFELYMIYTFFGVLFNFNLFLFIYILKNIK
jgi:hypothetical protein